MILPDNSMTGVAIIVGDGWLQISAKLITE